VAEQRWVSAGCSIASLRQLTGRGREWQDALVVAIQIRGVSEVTRRTLSAEAKARGESLQEYLLDVLDREAEEIDNRQLLADWAAGSAAGEPELVRLVELHDFEPENAKAIR
jgi:antitoxin FitA